jgi:hypothetical protein
VGGGRRSVRAMELVVAFVSALLGLSTAFFLSISFYDLLPEGWSPFHPHGRTVTFDAVSRRRPMLPSRIHHTRLN